MFHVVNFSVLTLYTSESLWNCSTF